VTGFLLILVGAALVPEPGRRARRRAGLAALATGLALATLRAAPSAPGSLGLPGFVATDAALLVLGVLAAMTAAVEVLRAPRSALTTAAAGLLIGGAGAAGWGGRPIIAAAAPGAALVALMVLAAAGALLLAVGRFVRLPSLDAGGPPHRPAAGVAGLLAGAIAAAAGPRVGVVLTGVIVAAWSGYLLQRAVGGSKVPLAPALTLLLLPAWWLMATIAGPIGLGTSALSAVPFSPAAEGLLAPALLLGGWALAGLWPLDRQEPASLTAIVGALLVVRIAIPSVPEGIDHWRPLAMPLVVAGIWHAALSGQLPSILIGLAWVGLLAATRDGCIGAGLLLAAGLGLELSGRRAGRPAVRAAVALLAGWGALLAVAAGLRGEVVYTVLAVGGIVVALGRPDAAQTITASDRSVTAPSA
jgi:hypothetical protein